ncbi:UNVERIFIED_ORG: hypothetical protein M2435_004629 [Rhizobium sophorae]|uniref:hypothetical protein n=1 Tax=Rhizobium TaxID=379 RepID=UPI0010312C03|nr:MULTISPECIES: hypothetical protein [Rhizobium]MBB4524633.1 hypothetical protein [Rhizobium leguminosarum]MDH6661708.1 hypothetical protein [Rhizobium sophorae]TBE47766.1 hypothetical protein ELH06_00500 [Rhizobium ruizarguesonis]
MEQFQAGIFAQEYATVEGQKMWAVLNREDVIARMETASDLGQPALKPVEDVLLEELGEVIMQDRYKQMCGRMVKQVLEGRGFVHDASGIRLNSVPFYKASRYRRDRTGLFLFRSSTDPRDICLTADRAGEHLPLPERGRWDYVHFVISPLKATVGYSFDLNAAIAEVKRTGFCRHRVPRLFRAAR